MEVIKNGSRYIDLADGQILEVKMNGPNVWLYGRDWREQEFVLHFEDMLGAEFFGLPGNGDLSHCDISSTDPFLDRARQITEVTEEGYFCFTFWLACSDEYPDARIVAKSYSTTWIGDPP